MDDGARLHLTYVMAESKKTIEELKERISSLEEINRFVGQQLQDCTKSKASLILQLQTVLEHAKKDSKG